VTEPSEFTEYRVRLLRAHKPILGRTTPRGLWRKILLRGQDTTYQRDRLVARYGEEWASVLEKAAADEELDIFGSNDGREWVLVSTWRPTARRESSKAPPVGESRAAVRDQMRAVLGRLDREPSRGKAAWHMHRQGLTREDIEKTMKELGWHVTANTVRDHLKYGRRVEDRGEQCPFDTVP
jgi:hypothetical protein